MVKTKNILCDRADEKLRERIIITSRTPTKTHWQDPRVEFVAIDFLAPLEEVIQAMESHCSGVTHAYFTSYVHIDNFKLLAETNIPLFENFLNAIDAVAGDSLQRVCLQTGGKVVSFVPLIPKLYLKNIS